MLFLYSDRSWTRHGGYQLFQMILLLDDFPEGGDVFFHLHLQSLIIHLRVEKRAGDIAIDQFDILRRDTRHEQQAPAGKVAQAQDEFFRVHLHRLLHQDGVLETFDIFLRRNSTVNCSCPRP